MNRIIKHLYFLTKKLPDRGSATVNERKAAQYVSLQLKKFGYQPVTQTFLSAKSAYYPGLLFGAISAISILFYILSPYYLVAIVSIILMLFFLVSVLIDSAFRDNIMSAILPKKHSQNIIAKLPSYQKEKNSLVIIAHIDSHRTPLLFSSPFWVAILKALIPLGAGGAIISCGFISYSIFSGITTAMVIAFVCLFLFFTILALLMVQADLTPFTTGANDNASGVAGLLVIAEALKKKPFKHSSVYFVASGSEEVGSYGARAFLKEYRKTLGDCYWLTIDGISAQNAYPAVICSEKFFLEVKSDTKMLDIAKIAMKENIASGAFLLPLYQGAYTDSSPAGLQGCKVMSVIALRKDGVLPDWHTLGDNYESIDRKTIFRSLSFIKTYMDVYRREVG